MPEPVDQDDGLRLRGAGLDRQPSPHSAAALNPNPEKSTARARKLNLDGVILLSGSNPGIAEGAGPGI